MKSGVTLLIGGAIGTVFGAAAVTSGIMLLGQYDIDSTQNLLDTEEYRLADEFVSEIFLQSYPDLVPHKKFIVGGAKFFLEQNESVLCPMRGNPICEINETHEQALLRAVVQEAIVATSGDETLDSIRKELEGLLKKSTLPEAEPSAPEEETIEPSVGYKQVRFPPPYL